jgi:hypothetical protein
MATETILKNPIDEGLSRDILNNWNSPLRDIRCFYHSQIFGSNDLKSPPTWKSCIQFWSNRKNYINILTENGLEDEDIPFLPYIIENAQFEATKNSTEFKSWLWTSAEIELHQFYSKCIYLLISEFLLQQ